MRPTSAELIESISEALGQTVLPVVADDKWAASVVRSAMTLLAHLAKRIELEAPVLIADNDDAHAVLVEIYAGGPLPEKYFDLQKRLKETLEGRTETAPFDVTALDARNRGYQTVIEGLLAGLYDSPGEREANIRSTLCQYLKRRLERERDIYFPAFTGPPF